ncbi:MAG: type VI secretion system tube protein Hcp [Vicinamibacterales bacterium]
MAVDMFLKIDGIDGESMSHKHKGEIELLSFSWGLSQTISQTGGGGGAGKVNVSDLSFVKLMDTASPQLMEKCCQGQHISDATLTISSRERPVEYLKIKLQDILVSSYQTGGANNGGVLPMDSVSLNFANVDITASDRFGKVSQVSCNFVKLGDTIGHHHD